MIKRIFLTLLVFTSAQSYATRLGAGWPDCGPILGLVNADVAYHAAAPTHDDFLEARHALIRALAELPVWEGRDWLTVVGPDADKVSTTFSLAAYAYVRGIDSYADKNIREFIAILRERRKLTVSAESVWLAIRRVADDPRFEPLLGNDELEVKGIPPVEAFMADMIQRSKPGPWVMGPQHLEVTKLLYQFGFVEPNSRILHIGLGAPSILRAYARYAPAREHLHGYDPVPLSPAQRELLRTENVRIKGEALDNGLFDRLRVNGPYRLISALDLFSDEPAIVTDVTKSPGELARALRGLLTPGGTIILVNDFGARPLFSKKQAENAGFHVVRWDLRRKVHPMLLDLAGVKVRPDHGDLRVYVLRNGPENNPQLRKPRVTRL